MVPPRISTPFFVACFAVSLVVLLTSSAAIAADAQEWQAPEVTVPERDTYPLLICEPEGIQRLRAAWADEDHPWHDRIAEVVQQGEKALEQELRFPPRGGHHRQWYQCNECEAPLKTLSETEHQCPVCKKVYSGEPYDDVIFRQIHGRNIGGALNTAWAYAITQEDRFADHTRAVLLGYAQRYMDYPYRHASRTNSAYAQRAGGRLNDQTLGESTLISRLIGPAYDLILPTLSQNDQESIKDGLIRPILDSVKQHQAGKSNWQSFHNSALIWGGVLLGNDDDVRRAILDPKNGFIYQMGASVTEDGTWSEGSWSYHWYALEGVALTVRAADRLGIDLWSHPTLKKMFTSPVYYVMPDGSLPRFGNASNPGLTVQYTWLVEEAYAAYEDPALLPVMREEPTWEAYVVGTHDVPNRGKLPPLDSIVMRGAGHAILRTHGEAGLTAAIPFGKFGGSHDHLDKLSFVLFAYGQELAVDRGRAAEQAYRMPIHRQWYRNTASHNTVLVDREQQAETGGRHLLFQEPTGQDPARRHVAFAAELSESYPDLVHKRLFVLMPDYLLTFDELVSTSGERRFDWLYHNRGDGAESELSTSAVDFSGEEGSFQYLEDTRQAETDDPVYVWFNHDQVTMHVRMAATDEAAGAAPTRQQLTLGTGPGTSIMERVPMMMLTSHGDALRAAATYEPVRNGDSPAIQTVAYQQAEDGGYTIRVTHNAGTDVIRWNGSDDITVTPAAAD